MTAEGESNWQKYRPANEPYMGAKLLEGLPYLFGKRGDFLVRLFAYLRWVDDLVDERKDLTKQRKLGFLEKQMGIVAGFVPEEILPMERMFSELPWKSVPEKGVRHRINIILGSIADDVEHQGFRARTDREVRHYNWRTIQPAVDGLFLVLNGKPMREDISMMQLLDAYIRIGSLEGLADDLIQEVVKLPVSGDEKNETSLAKVLREYDKQRFDKVKSEALRTIAANITAFMRLDVPIWQKLACVVYFGEVLLKKSFMVDRKRSLRVNTDHLTGELA